MPFMNTLWRFKASLLVLLAPNFHRNVGIWDTLSSLLTSWPLQDITKRSHTLQPTNGDDLLLDGVIFSYHSASAIICVILVLKRLQNTAKIVIKSKHFRDYTSILHERISSPPTAYTTTSQCKQIECSSRAVGTRQPAIHDATLTMSMFVRDVVKESRKKVSLRKYFIVKIRIS